MRVMYGSEKYSCSGYRKVWKLAVFIKTKKTKEITMFIFYSCGVIQLQIYVIEFWAFHDWVSQTLLLSVITLYPSLSSYSRDTAVVEEMDENSITYEFSTNSFIQKEDSQDDSNDIKTIYSFYIVLDVSNVFGHDQDSIVLNSY